MAAVLGELSDMVFRRIMRKNVGDFSINQPMLNVLLNLDGQKNVQEIASITKMSTVDIKKSILTLVKLGLIELDETAIPILDREFINFLNVQLSNFVGPVADILLEDVAFVLGYDLFKIPADQASILVKLLAKEISDKTKRTAFLKIIMESSYHEIILRSRK